MLSGAKKGFGSGLHAIRGEENNDFLHTVGGGDKDETSSAIKSSLCRGRKHG